MRQRFADWLRLVAWWIAPPLHRGGLVTRHPKMKLRAGEYVLPRHTIHVQARRR